MTNSLFSFKLVYLALIWSSVSYLILTSISNPIPYLSFMCYEDPKHLNSPSTIIPILVQRASASSIEWVVKITVLCLRKVDMFEIIVHMNRLAWGSTPVEGSSSSTIGGLPINAIAHCSFRLLPPDNYPA